MVKYYQTPFKKSHSNRGAYKLRKQICIQKLESRLYGVKIDNKITSRLVSDDMAYIDLPDRSSGKVRSWKKYRKTQYK